VLSSIVWSRHDAAGAAAATHHVVIVDDSELSMRLIGSVAGQIPGVVLHPFATSIDAVAQCRDEPVDCFIVDYHSNAPDELEAIRAIRAIPAFALVPIVVATGERRLTLRLRALDAGASDVIAMPVDRREFVARLAMHLSLNAQRRRRIVELESSLHDESAQTRRLANRLAALWRVANNPLLDDDALIAAMLREGAEGLREGEVFSALLGRLDDDAIVVDATFNGGVAEEHVADLFFAGHRFDIAGSALLAMIRSGSTRSWTDSARDPEVAGLRRLALASSRDVIVAPVAAGGATHFLLFASLGPMATPFTADDHAYVEVLASLFSSQLHARWQSNRIRYQCEHDPLTGLRNRAHFRSAGRVALQRDGCGAIAIVNVDHFRGINEMYGGLIGDAVLVEIGAALEQRAEGDEFAARLDGDTFGIYLPGVRSREVVERRTAAFAAAFDRPFSTGDRDGTLSISVTATLGVAVAPDDGATFEAILARAEAAVAAAKADPRSRITFFTSDMEGQGQWRTRLTNELGEALERDEFVLHFQPHLDLHTGRVTGAEALIRWNHPIRGLVAPSEFVPFAERHGLINAIGACVLDKAIAAATRLRQIDPAFRLYFNLSAVQLEDDRFIDAIAAAAGAGAPLENLGVEITETAAMRDVQATLRLMGAMRAHGMHIAIDDFGVGYSSLSLLKLLPLNIVKIDRSFIASVLEDPHDAIVVEGIVSIVQRFGALTLAEGVEQNEQRAWLMEKGCRYVQGYAVCVPLAMDAFIAWWQAERSLARS
jgi:diguanylate cyclase (GGDEF)-like protein